MKKASVVIASVNAALMASVDNVASDAVIGQGSKSRLSDIHSMSDHGRHTQQIQKGASRSRHQ